jgi:hypothetical protein
MRSFNEPWEPEDIFDRQEAAERRAYLDRIKEQNDALAAQEAAAEAVRHESARQFTLETTRRAIRRDYEQAGVTPLQVGGDGTPTVSLPLLLSMGWTVVEFNGERQLVRTNHERPPSERVDHDG